VLDAYTYGFVLTELNLPFQSPEQTRAVAGGIFDALPPGAFPHLSEYAIKRALRPGYAYGNEFTPGLELVLEGLERARRAQRK
jgi:Tetracyclin repressor-like, C-terminal domain